MTVTTDPHALLDVSPGASAEEIRRSFRRLAFEVHPDRNREPGATEAFMALHQAYDALMEANDDDTVSADDVVDEMVRAASEVERRRGHAGAGTRAWQHVRIQLTQPFTSRLKSWMGRSEEWVVELHWKGLLDLRYDVLVAWDEITEVRERVGLLDLVLTPAGAVRLAAVANLQEDGSVYRFPLGESSRLAGLIRQQIYELQPPRDGTTALVRSSRE